MNVAKILDSVPGNRLQIVETGHKDTHEITRWVSYHPECRFESVGLHVQVQWDLHAELEKARLARFCTFHLGAAQPYLAKQTWIDVAFLNAKDLQATATETLLAMTAGAKIIVLQNYQTQAALAINTAEELGWIFDLSFEPYLVLRRPPTK